MIDLGSEFEKYNDEYLKFDLVHAPNSARPDLHAFILLDKLLPGKRDLVSAAEHDEIWLDVDCGELAKVIDPEQVKELVCCGVRFDSDNDSLCLFV